MPHQYNRAAARRPSGGERVFVDEAGRVWSAAALPAHRPRPSSGGRELALVFTCVSDARLAQRAAAAPAGARLLDLTDHTLRAWLTDAPRLGRLS